MKTGSFEQSRVETRKWVKIIWSECASDNLNCADFTTQSQAQAKYEYCADKISRANSHIWGKDKVKSLDIYWLDGDKDGMVCEALPVS